MMRYKGLVTAELERIDTLLKTVQSGLNNSSITPKDAYDKVSESVARLDNVMEKIRLEPDQTS